MLFLEISRKGSRATQIALAGHIRDASLRTYKTLQRPRAPINWREFFGYNSPAAIARELFKPSTDAASLLGSIKKIFFDLGEGFAWERLAKWGCFCLFGQI